MFDPKLQDVRRFFCGVWRKHLDKLPLEPIEALALDWILQHPEYQQSLADPDKAVAADYSPQAGRSNPFLHLSLHLAISEQLSIDQPPGIRACFSSSASSAAPTTPLTRRRSASPRPSGSRSARPAAGPAGLPGLLRRRAGLPIGTGSARFPAPTSL